MLTDIVVIPIILATYLILDIKFNALNSQQGWGLLQQQKQQNNVIFEYVGVL